MLKSVFPYMVVAAIALVSCQNDNSSRTIAEKFLKAYSSKQFDEAKKYATKRTHKMIDIAGKLSTSAPKNVKSSEFEILDCLEKGDRAVVKYRTKGSKNQEVIYMIKKNETWLVGMHE